MAVYSRANRRWRGRMGERRNARNRSVDGQLVALCACFALTLCAPAVAQYVFDPDAADEQPGIRYFGSAKDERGALLPRVTIRIDSSKTDFVVVTNEQGRFSANLPLELTPDKITATCSRAGFELVRLTKRNGPIGPRLTVQIDCVLRPAKSG
jgi:hypothetical protein